MPGKASHQRNRYTNSNHKKHFRKAHAYRCEEDFYLSAPEQSQTMPNHLDYDSDEDAHRLRSQINTFLTQNLDNIAVLMKQLEPLTEFRDGVSYADPNAKPILERLIARYCRHIALLGEKKRIYGPSEAVYLQNIIELMEALKSEHQDMLGNIAPANPPILMQFNQISSTQAPVPGSSLRPVSNAISGPTTIRVCCE